MKKELLNTKHPFPENLEFDSSLVVFDLPDLIVKMKQNNDWLEGKLNSIILLKSIGKQIVLIAMHEGTEIQSFLLNGSITFQIIEGKVIYHAWKRTTTIDKGQFLTLHENVNYSLTTKEDTVLLLTIAADPFMSL